MVLANIARRALRHSPALVQHLFSTGRGAWHLFTEVGPEFRRAVHWLLESQWWDAARIRNYQDARLREMVAHAYETAPFYRSWFDAAGVRPGDIQTQDDLRKLPVLTKRIVHAQQRRMISRRYRGHLLTARSTSGTTGTAITVYATPQARALHRALVFRHRSIHGFRRRDWVLRFTAQLGLLSERRRPPFWWYNLANNHVLLAPTHLSHPLHVRIVTDWLIRRRFGCFTGWPSAMLNIANDMRDRGLKMRHPPRLIDYTSETLLTGAADRIRRAFDCPALISTYDMAEQSGMMGQCEHGRLHLDFEIGCLETQPVESAGGQCRLIFTGLANHAMPFIRYDVGDLGRPADGPCPCGRQTPSFLSIDGRLDAYVRTPDGRRAFGLNVHLPSAREVQVCQKRIDSIEVRVVRGPDYDPGDEAEMLRRLRTRVGAEMNIEIVYLERIARSPSGKFRSVVSELTDQSPEQRELAAAARR